MRLSNTATDSSVSQNHKPQGPTKTALSGSLAAHGLDQPDNRPPPRACNFQRTLPPHAGSSPRSLHHHSSRSQHAPAPAHSRAHTPHPTSPPQRSHRNPATTIEQSHIAATTPLVAQLPSPHLPPRPRCS